LRKIENQLDNKHMNEHHHHQTSTPDADICGELRTMSGPDERLKVAAYTLKQIWTFCRSHTIPFQRVAWIRRPDHLHGWRSKRLLLLPLWRRNTEEGTIPAARAQGWEIVEVTEDEVLNGPKPDQPAPAPDVVGQAKLIEVRNLLGKIIDTPEDWDWDWRTDARELHADLCEMLKPDQPNPAPSVTPRVDAEHARFPMGGFTLDFCREMECELAEAREQRDRLAVALKNLMAEYDDRKNQFGDSPLWTKHEEVEVIEEGHAMIAEMRKENVQGQAIRTGSATPPTLKPQ
jgi:hypothetical protein